jgi:alginate O-acetyltransferase complex protein AlgF
MVSFNSTMWRHASAAFTLACAAMGSAHADDPKLYDTGPGGDATFVRFLNTTEQALEVRSSNKSGVSIRVAQPVTNYFPISPKVRLKGALVQGSSQKDIDLAVKSGEFVTVVGTKAGGTLSLTAVTENPDDFNALKSSLAFYNLDAQCKVAGLLASGRGVAIFNQVPPATMQRRSINPVALAVEAQCGGQSVGAKLDLGTLDAGKRYSVFLLPGLGQGPQRLVFAPDTIAH